MNWLRKRIQTKIKTNVRATCKNIDVLPLQGLFNRQCHNNCVEYSRLNPTYGIVEVIYIDNGAPILHYVNTKKGKFYETTLGYKAKDLEYYKIRTINKVCYKYIISEFTNSYTYWDELYTNSLQRRLFNLDRLV
jgi:hypothetical protein